MHREKHDEPEPETTEPSHPHGEAVAALSTWTCPVCGPGVSGEQCGVCGNWRPKPK